MKKLIIFLLVLSTLLCVFAGCKGNKGGEITTETPKVETPPEAAKPQTYNELSKVDLGGYEFKILTRQLDSSVWSNIDWDYEGDPADPTIDVISEAVYKRNDKVETDYNCSIKQIGVANADLLASAQNDALMGNGDYDVYVLPFSQQINKMALEGCLRDLNTVQSFDMSAPWWDEKTNNSLALFDRTYTMCGDINIIDDMATWIVAFNKNLASKYPDQIGNHYDTVTNGQWTWEKMYENAELFADETHETYGKGNYGIISQYEVVNVFLASAQMPTITQNAEEGTFTNYIRDYRFESVISDIFDLMYDEDIQVYADNDSSCESFVAVNWGEPFKIFKQDRALYYVTPIGNYVNAQLSDMAAPTGVLPFPKQEGQENYISTLQPGNATGFSIAKYISAEKAEQIGILLTAMSAASMADDNEATSTLSEAFYDRVLYGRKIKDEESAAMLDLIFESRVIDLGVIMSSEVVWTTTFIVRDHSSANARYQYYHDKYAGALQSNLNNIAYAILNNFPPKTDAAQ